MPLIRIQTAEPAPEALLLELSRITAETLKKSEAYVMVTANTGPVLIDRKPGQAAFLDVSSIGALSSQVNRQLSAAICALLDSELGIPPERVYIHFSMKERPDWGWNNSTFG